MKPQRLLSEPIDDSDLPDCKRILAAYIRGDIELDEAERRIDRVYCLGHEAARMEAEDAQAMADDAWKNELIEEDRDRIAEEMNNARTGQHPRAMLLPV